MRVRNQPFLVLNVGGGHEFCRQDRLKGGRGLGNAYCNLVTIAGIVELFLKLGVEVLASISHASVERPLHTNELFCTLRIYGHEYWGYSCDKNTTSIISTLLFMYTYISPIFPTCSISPSSMIAEVCLTRLNFRRVSGVFPTVDCRYASYN